MKCAGGIVGWSQHERVTTAAAVSNVCRVCSALCRTHRLQVGVGELLLRKPLLGLGAALALRVMLAPPQLGRRLAVLTLVLLPAASLPFLAPRALRLAVEGLLFFNVLPHHALRHLVRHLLDLQLRKRRARGGQR